MALLGPESKGIRYWCDGAPGIAVCSPCAKLLRIALPSPPCGVIHVTDRAARGKKEQHDDDLYD
jgi:hypothetical protein